MKQAQQDQVTRAARRAVLIDGLPVSNLGVLALALGSNPDHSATQKAWWITTAAVFTLANQSSSRLWKSSRERSSSLTAVCRFVAAMMPAMTSSSSVSSSGVSRSHACIEGSPSSPAWTLYRPRRSPCSKVQTRDQEAGHLLILTRGRQRRVDYHLLAEPGQPIAEHGQAGRRLAPGWALRVPAPPGSGR